MKFGRSSNHKNVDDLERLVALKKSGEITESEFQIEKDKIIGQSKLVPETRVVVKRSRGSAGVIFAAFSCAFAVISLFSYPILFVPLAAICGLFGFLSGVVGLAFTSIFISLIGIGISALSFAASPSLWLTAAILTTAATDSSSTSKKPAQTETRETSPELLAISEAPSGPLQKNDVSSQNTTAGSDDSEIHNFTQSEDYQAGYKARAQWESTLSEMDNDARQGAHYWASHRSDKKPASCAQPNASDAWKSGCLKAKAQLLVIDEKRRANAGYKRGFREWKLSPE